MAEKTPPKPPRPLSPHLQIYKPQLTTGMSIFHRITGIGLAVGLPFFVFWLRTVAHGPYAYAQAVHCWHSPIGQALLIGWTFAFFYHFCCGVRHLLWDAGYFLTIEGVYSTGRVAISIAVLMTIALWLKVYGIMP